MTEQYIDSYTTPDTTLSGGISNVAPSLTVASLPPGIGLDPFGQFRIKIDAEILLVTAVGGAGNLTWTVTRGVDGTTAASHSTGAAVNIILTASGLRLLPPLANRLPTNSVVIPGGFSFIVVGDYEIPSGSYLELASNAVMEIS